MSVSTTIQLNDNASKVLKTIIKNMDHMIDVMEKIEEKSQSGIEAGTFDTMRISVKKATSELSNMQDEMVEVANTAQKVANSTQKSTSLATGFMQGLGQEAVRILEKAAAKAYEFGKQAVLSYGALEQNLGGTQAVFGKYAEKMKNTGLDAYKTMGASQSEFLANANKMGSLFQGGGLSMAQSAEMSTKALQRAADVASVMGISTEDAFYSIVGAAKGNYTMMDNLGVAMNQTTLEAYAAQKGLNFKWETATNAQKTQTAMQMFFEKTAKYAGNFEREATQTVTGSMGAVKASWSDFMAGLGNSQADIDKLADNLVNTIKTAIANIKPVVKRIFASLFEINPEWLAMIGFIGTALLVAFAPFIYGKIVLGILAIGKAITTVLIPKITALFTMILAHPVFAVIALVIAILGVLIYFINKAHGGADTLLGSILGGLSVIVSACWNTILLIGEFFMNLGSMIALGWNKLVNHIQVKFWGLVNSIVSMAEPLLILLGKLFGFDGKEVVATVKTKYDDALKKQENLAKGQADNIYGWGSQSGKLGAFEKGWNDAAFKKGAELGDRIGNKENNGEIPSGIDDEDSANLDATAGNTAATAANTAKISENMTWLRDIAERQAIERVAVSGLNIAVTNSNSFTNAHDVEAFNNSLVSMFRGMMVGAEAAHA